MRTRGWIVFVLLACLASLAGASVAAAADDPLLAPAGTCPSAEQLSLDPSAAQQSMLCLTNWARSHSGLAPLQLDASLDQAGKAKLTANLSCGEFSHTPCGSALSSVFGSYLAGNRGYQIGENIAWGTGRYGTARETMNGWLQSPGHRANILTAAYRDLGIGYLANQAFQGHDGAVLWSQEFGVRDGATAPSKKPQPKRPRSGRR